MSTSMRGKFSAAFGAATIVAVLTLLVPNAAAGAVARPNAGRAMVVNSTADRPDVTRNGVCATSVKGECTLRAAIQEADAAGGAATIAFAIPGGGVHKIAPTSALPIINNNRGGVTIDGFTQPGSHANTNSIADNAVYGIEIAGKGPSSFDGLVIQSAHNTVRGLDIHGFRHAIYMNAAAAAFNAVVGSMVGLLPNGAYDGAHPL